MASNVESIAQARIQPECVPLAIYEGEVPVGFIMYCIDRDDGDWWVYRFMVDKAHQGKGYGRAALGQVLDRMRTDPEHRIVRLGVEPENTSAIALYESFGFHFDGRVFGGEKTMLLTL